MKFKYKKIFKPLKSIIFKVYNRFISLPLFQRIEKKGVGEEDFLPHSKYAIEWWYFTGFLNKRFGFEITFFKVNIPPKVFIFHGPSIKTCISHFAITDVKDRKFFYDERIRPTILVWEEKELLIRNGPWILESDGNIYHAYVVSKDISMDIYMKPNSKMILHGKNGLIEMGDAGFSYYYTFPSMETEGYIKRNGKLFKVVGETWHDHQWGNFKIKPAWDWFSIRLKDKTYIMAFNLWDFKRRKLLIQYLTILRKDETKRFNEFKFKIVDRDYLSGKKKYPESWKLSFDKGRVRFIIEAMITGQEINSITTPDYYEGICKVRGIIDDKDVEGIAYIELTGYY